MLSIRTVVLMLLALVMTTIPSLALGQTQLPPRPQGPVADVAAVIPDQAEMALDAKLRAYNRTTGRAIIVATVPTLDGQVVERYAQDLARAWYISGKESQEGVLVLVAPTERKVRIHTGVGVQGRLTDGLASRIIREAMVPRFKAQDFAGGIDAGVDQIIAQLNRDETDAKAVAEAAEAARSARQSDQGEVSVMAVVFWIAVVLFLIMLMARSRHSSRRRRYGRGIDMWDIGEFAANVAANVAINSVLNGDGHGGGFGGGSDGGGFGGFGGGGGGFDGGGASGDW